MDITTGRILQLSSHKVALLGDVKVEIREARLDPDIEEVLQRETSIAFGVEAGEVNRSEGARGVLQIRNGVGYLSRRD